VALALVVEQRDRPAVLAIVGAQLVFQQALVDRAEVLLREVAIVDELALDARELVDGPLQVGVADGVACEEGMPRRVEEAAVEGRHLEGRAPGVDDAEQVRERGPKPGARRQQQLARVEVAGDGLFHRL